MLSGYNTAPYGPHTLAVSGREGQHRHLADVLNAIPAQLLQRRSHARHKDVRRGERSPVVRGAGDRADGAAPPERAAPGCRPPPFPLRSGALPAQTPVARGRSPPAPASPGPSRRIRSMKVRAARSGCSSPKFGYYWRARPLARPGAGVGFLAVLAIARILLELLCCLVVPDSQRSRSLTRQR